MHVYMESPQTRTETISQAYYDGNAAEYAAATRDVDVSALYDRFLKYLPPKAQILDAGSGSGRDTLAFLEHGYDVDAFDSSRALCELSTRLTGIRTRQLRFQDFEDVDKYDGIWACASLLHVPKHELADAIQRLVHSLKDQGVIYMSFKHGAGERISADGRFYTDMNAAQLKSLFEDISGAELLDVWITQGEGSFKGNTEWLNAIACKMPQVETA